MDEVDRARVELARLESVEQSHLHQMMAARRAAEAQRILIKELIKKRDPAIHRLPVELLVRIFGFAMANYLWSTSMIYQRRMKLAGVSRFWRDVILTTPALWCDIYLATSPREESMLISQLRRSQGAPLDITIAAKTDYSSFYKSLPYLRQTTNRWRSLCIRNDSYRSNVPAIIPELFKLDFPSLVDLSIDVQRDLEYQNILLRAPVLKHLELQNFVANDDFSIPNQLKTLKLEYGGSDIPLSFPSQIHNISLTVLSLTGRAHGWVLEPTSINFPILEELTLNIPHPEKFLEAIIAPNLQHFRFLHDKGHWETLGLSGSKFRSVHHLTIDAVESLTHPFNGVAFCQAFPKTRHAEFSYVSDLDVFFTPVPIPGNSMGSRSPVDNWVSLERLTISDFFDYMHAFEPLVQWLETRQELGLPKLHVELAGHPEDLLDAEELSTICRRLQDHCILELGGLSFSPHARVNTRSAGSPYLVLPAIDPALINDIFWTSAE
ncbi:hypothetical protein EDD16DRAFT_1645921 [Pisolithus croceorrhizus]|nr:hypothetical protein EDD16DRAFT_1645921 [Pisolithus croceorrhizus]KAI6120178.1 hypothetical protein EV401DRAFT_1956643 [Pisolithus croceorrhizus]